MEKQHTSTTETLQTNNQASKNSLKIATITLSILVVILAGLSTLLLVKLSSDNDNGNEISNNNGIGTNQDENENASSGQPESSVPAADEYLLIKEWGIKYKIPETLHDVDYFIANEYAARFIAKPNQPIEGVPTEIADKIFNDVIKGKYSDPFNCSFGIVERMNKYPNDPNFLSVVKIGDYYFAGMPDVEYCFSLSPEIDPNGTLRTSYEKIRAYIWESLEVMLRNPIQNI